MLYYLTLLGKALPGLGLFRFLSFRIAGAALTAFVLALVLVPLVTRHGRRRGFRDREGKTWSRRLNELHAKKKDTPVLGGLAILAASLASILLWARVASFYVLLVVATLVLLGLVGLADDWVKTFGKEKREGLTPRQKLGAQVAIGLLAGSLLVTFYDGFSAFGANRALALELTRLEGAGAVPPCETAAAIAQRDHIDLVPCSCEEHKKTAPPARQLLSLYPPFMKDAAIPLGSVLFVLFCALVMTASSNAVNLTDGLDGLAGGCYVLAVLVYGILAYTAGRADWCQYLALPHVPGAGEVAVCCAALAGGTLGFLWFNAPPAELFMGDAGSLPLGGALGLVAVVTKHELLLPLVGLIFVAEAASVILQVSFFKLTGRRALRCAPLHHHFEFQGWAETKVVVRFWIVAALAALAALATLKVR
ncbi:phospho-N-acetylmuramoyl-pentapeptide-transferase [bacterium]|nr:phospho-N-acetylmuramoyl-pentapeptide-transferase [bacterium]